MNIGRDIKSYHDRMGANVNEKASFIIDELKIREYDVIIDFGCADGRLTKYLASQFPDKIFIGVDFKEIIDMNDIEDLENVAFTEYIDYKKLKGKRYMVIFSSVIHELSYLNFYKIVTEQFRTASAILIRDMYSTQTGIERIKLQDKIMKTLYENNYNAELNENYFFIDWKLIDEIIFQIGLVEMLDYGYKNEWLLEKVQDTKPQFTHKQLVYVKPLNHY